jgi:hypothetical protein
MHIPLYGNWHDPVTFLPNVQFWYCIPIKNLVELMGEGRDVLHQQVSFTFGYQEELGLLRLARRAIAPRGTRL